ncbi:MAG: YdcF family protein [Bryobacteraceae bacterium]
MKKLGIVFSTVGVLIVLAVLLRAPILTTVGSYLVRDGPPEKADLVVVLGGDFLGNRILKAAELVRQGYAPRVLVSGPAGAYGHYECDLAIPFAVSAGYPEAYFIPFEHNAHSTLEEAQAIVPKVRELHANHVLLVTSDYHTRRAGNIFRSLGPDITWSVVAAPDAYFSAQGWWLNREGRKTAAIEWAKTVAEWIGL